MELFWGTSPDPFALCYLHTLGGQETALLTDFQSRLPALLAKVRDSSEDARKAPVLSIWGVNLQMPSEARDIVLLKFLRAAEMKVDQAVDRLVKTLEFRADCHIDEVAKSDLPIHFKGHDFVRGKDVDGRALMISRFGGMDLPKVFGDVEAFVRYRSKLMEEAMSQLSLRKGQPEDLCQVHDYSGVPLLFQTAEIKGAVAAVTKVFAEHYPETKGKTIFVNFPAAFAGLFKAFSVFIPARTRKKFLILGEEDHETLFQHVKPEMVPEGLGGMQRQPGSRLDHVPCHLIPVGARACEEVVLSDVTGPTTLLWEFRVCSADITYEVFFHANGTEQLLSGPQLLQASDGIAGGEFRATQVGSLRCRFHNDGAWFKSRLCICRAGTV